MKRTVTALLSTEEVARILSRHILDAREIEVVEDSQMECELMASFGKLPDGSPGIVQYRLEMKVEEQKEAWRGE